MRYIHECRDQQQCCEERVPRITIMETGTVVVVKAEMPGLRKEDVSVEVHDGTLTIRGETPDAAVPEGYVALYQERYLPVYRRTIELGNQIDTEKIGAVYEQGILTLTLAKKEKVQPKKIPVS